MRIPRLLFWLAAVHGALAGTDAGHPAVVAGSFASIAIVLFLTVFLLLLPGGPRGGLRRRHQARSRQPDLDLRLGARIPLHIVS